MAGEKHYHKTVDLNKNKDGWIYIFVAIIQQYIVFISIRFPSQSALKNKRKYWLIILSNVLQGIGLDPQDRCGFSP